MDAGLLTTTMSSSMWMIRIFSDVTGTSCLQTKKQIDINFIYSAVDVTSVSCPQVLISDEPVVVAKDPFKMAYKSWELYVIIEVEENNEIQGRRLSVTQHDAKSTDVQGDAFTSTRSFII